MCPVVTLVSDHPVSARQHFVGIDNTAAGQDGGPAPRTVSAREEAAKIGAHRRFSGTERPCRTVCRAARTVLSRRISRILSSLKVREGRDDNARNADLVERLLQEHADLAGLYNIGAGNRGIIATLSRAQSLRTDLVFVGHELTPYTREMRLQAGIMDAVIAQDPGHEIRSAVRVLKALCDKKPIIEGQERIGIDIFLKDNLPGSALTRRFS